MYRRNISNVFTFNEINTSGINIKGSGDVLSIFGIDSDVPLYTFNTTDRVFNVTGDFTVTGTAEFTNTNITQVSGGILNLASNNTSDSLDIGVSGKTVVGGVDRYTGIVRDASDVLKRWTLYDNVTAAPTTTVTLDSTVLSSLRANSVYINDGTATNPSIVFDLNTPKNTGLYRKATNTIGISSNGVDSLIISDTQNTSVNDFKTAAGFTRANFVLLTSSLLLSNLHYMVECVFAGETTVTLPTITGNAGREYLIIKTSITGTSVTVNTFSGTEYIDDNASTSIVLNNQYDRVTLIAGSTIWYSI